METYMKLTMPTFEETVEHYMDPYYSDKELIDIVEDKKRIWTEFARKTAAEALRIRKEKTEKC